MAEMTLYIGNKWSSSWPMRAWLALKLAGVNFESEMVLLNQPDSKKHLLEISPAGRVPVLDHNGLRIWDTLAIIEYLWETFPNTQLWPRDPTTRPVARSVSATMHSDFPELRAALPMNIIKKWPSAQGRNFPSNTKLLSRPGVKEQIDRIIELWRFCRNRYGEGGSFLFGDFTAADAIYAPVCSRFITYNVDLPEDCRAYVDAVMTMPLVREWIAEAEAQADEFGRDAVLAYP